MGSGCMSVYVSKPNEWIVHLKSVQFILYNYTSIKVILKEVIEKRNVVIKNKDAKDGVNSSLIMIWRVVT